jgi:hypothetical protein
MKPKLPILILSLFLLHLTGFTCTNDKVRDESKSNANEQTNEQTKDEKPGISKTEGIYIGETDEKGVLIEDNRTWNKDGEFKSDDSEGYIKYIEYVRSTTRKYSTEENPIEVIIDGYKPEFDRITDLKEGDKVYIATKDNVLEGSIARYYINMDDEIGSGNMFYAIADIPNALLMQTGEPVVVSRMKMENPVNSKNVTDASVTAMAKKIIEPMVKDVKMNEDYGNPEDRTPVKVEGEDLTILDKGNGEYVVGFSKRLSFDSFTGTIFTMDKSGKMVNTVSRFTPGDFGYSKLLGIIDLNNDGGLEYLVESGYYEGAGYILYNSNDGKLTEVASGFFFGV